MNVVKRATNGLAVKELVRFIGRNCLVLFPLIKPSRLKYHTFIKSETIELFQRERTKELHVRIKSSTVILAVFLKLVIDYLPKPMNLLS